MEANAFYMQMDINPSFSFFFLNPVAPSVLHAIIMQEAKCDEAREYPGFVLRGYA